MEDAIVISASVRSRHYGKLSGGLAPLPGVARVGALEAIHMPRVAVRPLRSSLCRFPPCFPGFAEPGGEAKNGPEGPF
jgi:CHAD domain-containing protein